mgnify:CR=1 FL=1
MATNITLNPSIVAQGNAWALQIATGSAFTYVNAWPTTRAELVLYNPASNTKSLIIDYAWMVDISTAAAAHCRRLLHRRSTRFRRGSRCSSASSASRANSCNAHPTSHACTSPRTSACATRASPSATTRSASSPRPIVE